ncbi:MAG: winged helix-turn-helix domain-containing protein [Alphaproteobacteria bacterium]|nr:winged helix-turn-helix domain-containing protein [Alphaproteobacteria bacterium]MCB9794353.1 winged helix-turn-helix domain-containing protein [Alphaproteobacteria bacterium]
MHADASVIPLQGCTLDLVHRTLTREGEVERLSARELRLLRYLIDREGQIVTREELEQEVWGFRPGVQSEAAAVGMRRLRARLERDPRHPVHLHTVRGVGWTFVLPEPEQPPVGPRSNLPGAPTPLVGRVEELRALLTLLKGPGRLSCLVGPPGVGKTRLAQEAARALLATRPEQELWWLSLNSPRAREDLNAALAGVLGLGGAARLLPALSGRGPVLLVLDDAEALSEAQRAALSSWWGARNLRVLLISRERPGLEGARVLPLGPLTPDDAQALLLRRARAARPGFEAAPEHLARVARALDGLPLAIELTANRARLMGGEALAEDAEARAMGGALADAVTWSLDRLEPAHRAALGRLLAFAGPFDLESARALLEGLTLSPDEALLALADRSLLRTLEGPRFEVLSTVRRQLLQLEPLSSELAERHLRHLVERGERTAAALRAQGTLPRLRALRALEPDLNLALQRAEGADRARLSLTLGELAQRDGDLQRRRQLLEALDPESLEDPELRLAVYTARGFARISTVRIDLAEPDLLLAGVEPHPRRVEALRGRVQLLVHAGRLDAAEQLALETLAAPDAGPSLRAALLGDLATARASQRRFGEAHVDLVEGRTLAADHGDTLRLAVLWTITADHASAGGDIEAALRAVEQALPLHREAGARLLEGITLTMLGRAYACLGDPAAEQHYRQAIAIMRALGRVVNTANTLENLSEHLFDQGKLDEAESMNMRAWLMVRGADGEGRLTPLIVASTGLLAWARGHHGLAANRLAEAVRRARAVGIQRVESNLCACHAALLAELGEREAALEALELARRPNADAVDQALFEVPAAYTHLALDGEREAARHLLERLRAPSPGGRSVWGTRADVRILGRLLEARLAR